VQENMVLTSGIRYKTSWSQDVLTGSIFDYSMETDLIFFPALPLTEGGGVLIIQCFSGLYFVETE